MEGITSPFQWKLPLTARPHRSPPVSHTLDSPLEEGAFDIAGKFPVEDETSRNAKAALFEGGGSAKR